MRPTTPENRCGKNLAAPRRKERWLSTPPLLLGERERQNLGVREPFEPFVTPGAGVEAGVGIVRGAKRTVGTSSGGAGPGHAGVGTRASFARGSGGPRSTSNRAIRIWRTS